MKRGHQWNLPRCAPRDLSILRGGAGRPPLLSIAICSSFTTLGKFWHCLAIFASFGNFERLLPCFCGLGLLSQTFGFFFEHFVTLFTFWPVLSLCHFWQFLPMLAIFLAILSNSWKFLATFAFGVTTSACHQAILSSCHLFIFSS